MNTATPLQSGTASIHDELIAAARRPGTRELRATLGADYDTLSERQRTNLATKVQICRAWKSYKKHTSAP